MTKITENNIETFAIETLQTIGWDYVHGLAIAPGAELLADYFAKTAIEL